MDIRTLVCGALAALAFICGTILTAIQLHADAPIAEVLAVGALTFGAGSTFTGYVVGLHSEPWSAPPEGDT